MCTIQGTCRSNEKKRKMYPLFLIENIFNYTWSKFIGLKKCQVKHGKDNKGRYILQKQFLIR